MMNNERGVALIITLLVVALLAITVVEFSYSVEIDARMARNALNGLQATLLARSGINLGEALLLHDDIKKTPRIDAFTQEWCPSPGPDATSCLIDESNSQILIPENMRLRVQIFDEGAKLNVNATRVQGNSRGWQTWQTTHNNPTADAITAFERLCAARGVDSNLASGLIDYWRNATEAAEQAAGVASASASPPVGSPTVQPTVQPQRNQQQAINQYLAQYEFKSIDDLGSIPGFTPSVINRLRPVLTAWPLLVASSTRPTSPNPNVNTAPRQILDAIYGESDSVENIISQRQNGPLQQAPQAGNPQTMVGTLRPGNQSQLFLIRASAIINPDPLTGRGGIRRSASMVVLRGTAVGPSSSGSLTTGPGGLHWTLTQLDWQKEGGAALFEPPKDGEAGTDETASSMLQQ